MEQYTKTLSTEPLSTGSEATKSSQEIFSKLLDIAPKNPALKAACLETPLGPMIAVADEEALFLLEFIDRKNLHPNIDRLKQKTKLAIVSGQTQPIESIQQELHDYFSGRLRTFKTPLFLLGSPFQMRVWETLRTIPHGKTCSYAEIAAAIDKPYACRAVARANSTNGFAIAIPCHRVIQADGGLGGYAGGIARKTWLLQHEKVGVPQ